MVVQHRLKCMTKSLLIFGQTRVQIFVKLFRKLTDNKIDVINFFAVHFDERQLSLLRLVAEFVVDVLKR